MTDQSKLNELYTRINDLTNIVNDLLEDKEIATDLSKALETRDFVYSILDIAFTDLDYLVESDTALDKADLKEPVDKIAVSLVEYYLAKKAYWDKAKHHVDNLDAGMV